MAPNLFKRGVASSKAITFDSTRTAYGFKSKQRVLTPQSLQRENIDERVKAVKRKAEIQDHTHRTKVMRTDSSDQENVSVDELDMAGLLAGDQVLSLSHAGGEFGGFLLEDIAQPRVKKTDSRTRRDRVERRNLAFAAELPRMCKAYMDWEMELGEGGLDSAVPPPPVLKPRPGAYKVKVIDTYRSFSLQTDVITNDESGVAAEFVRLGLMPSAPTHPSLVVTTRLLELYRNTHLCCPHLSIQPFVKSICNAHHIPFNSYLSQQFSIAYDAYLAVRAEVKACVDTALGRDAPYWRLQHCCPACTYKLDGEPAMKFSMLFTMDGNDSLKRVFRREQSTSADNGHLHPQGCEAFDSREVRGDYYLSREEVDLWAQSSPSADRQAVPMGEVDDDNPCASRWNNMSAEKTSRMWGIFDESGVFLSLCRHGYVLLITDMVRSGELSKYALSTVDTLIDVFGDDIGGGYDIGCKFKATISRSALSEKAEKHRYTSLVGAFHGHAHNRRCQLSNLATYVDGMGLEDLEGCERFFSKSNALASSVRYASVFHRKQKIVEYLEYTDNLETAQNLSTFLVNNYHQALDILNGRSQFNEALTALGIGDPADIEKWLEEERDYLLDLQHEPEIEAKHITYYEDLVKLAKLEDEAASIRQEWEVVDCNPNAIPGGGAMGKQRGAKGGKQHTAAAKNPKTRGIRLRHVLDKVDAKKDAVQRWEIDLDIEAPWKPGMPQWETAAHLANQREYQRALDNLEGLVVARMFELTKMNMSQTGYKQRKHIGNALKQRSQAISTALHRYNSAAKALKPPRETLAWEDVVQYASLADFDLLRNSRQDIRGRPWANHANRRVMDQYFKLRRAEEEIVRLNIEIQRVVTHLQDEDQFLSYKQKEMQTIDPPLAHQIHLYHSQRILFSSIHLRRFKKLAAHPQFTGSLTAGTPLDAELCAPILPTPLQHPISPVGDNYSCENDDDDDDDDDITGLSEAFAIMFTALD